MIETGSTDFAADIASPVTALITLDILGLPLSDWDTYAGPIRRNSVDDVSTKGVEISERIYPLLAETVAARRITPGTGLVDELIAARPNGEALSDETVVDMIWQLLVGGFNTTSALLSWSIYYLDQHREQHQQLIDDDQFLRIATEEFVRWSSPVNTLARTVVRDVEIEGQQISAGDRMLFIFGAANRDPEVFDAPDDVQLDRFPNRHFGWGTGIHRCLGSNLARLVFQETLRQTLKRMPDFTVDQENIQREPDRAGGNGWVSLPLRFTPGPRVNTEYAFLSEFF
ncbi:cytochrome P450 [Rhodococcus sp. WS3]|uniref:cytochrome P450 n=1 Tax=Rhodococcus sp. WS3 TaxID=2486271 RepID=UPI001650F1A6|nr:cytochrome P450 [Rhodococcus sp. WS3]